MKTIEKTKELGILEISVDAKKEFFRRNRFIITAKISIRIVLLLLLFLYVLIVREPVTGSILIDALYLVVIVIFITGIFLFFQWHEDIDLEEKKYELEKELKENLLEIQTLEKEFHHMDELNKEFSDAPEKIKNLKLKNERIGAGLRVLDM